jgi:hypothetical protein
MALARRAPFPCFTIAISKPVGVAPVTVCLSVGIDDADD